MIGYDEQNRVLGGFLSRADVPGFLRELGVRAAITVQKTRGSSKET